MYLTIEGGQGFDDRDATSATLIGKPQITLQGVHPPTPRSANRVPKNFCHVSFILHLGVDPSLSPSACPPSYTLVKLTDAETVVADYPVWILEVTAYRCNGGLTVDYVGG